jgi:nucleoside triphosphate pyrophosphatase
MTHDDQLTVVLASASPARLAVLRAAGIDPIVAVSHVDEDEILAGVAQNAPDEQVATLATAKADAIAWNLPDEAGDDCVVIGCDSMLFIEGELQGKPNGPEQALERWARMAGREGLLLTGHAVRRVIGGSPSAGAVATRSTIVRMGAPTPEELNAYIATGEPLAVAGALTIDGYGGWFVEGVDGDPSNVIGLSLPLTRRLLADVGVAVTDLWRRPASSAPPPPPAPAPTPPAPPAPPAPPVE